MLKAIYQARGFSQSCSSGTASSCSNVPSDDVIGEVLIPLFVTMAFFFSFFWDHLQLHLDRGLIVPFISFFFFNLLFVVLIFWIFFWSRFYASFCRLIFCSRAGLAFALALDKVAVGLQTQA